MRRVRLRASCKVEKGAILFAGLLNVKKLKYEIEQERVRPNTRNMKSVSIADPTCPPMFCGGAFIYSESSNPRTSNA